MSVPEHKKRLSHDHVIHPTAGAAPYRIAACVDTSAMARDVIAHAVAIANAMQGELTLIRVLETRPPGGTPADPVEWEIRRREAWDALGRIVEQQAGGIADIKAQVVEGHPAEQIWLWARDHDVALTVFCTHGEDNVMGRTLGKTASLVINGAIGSFLLVPRSATHEPVVRYRRILVPLDGSCQAESVLPFAVKLARANDGEIVLVHVVPVAELTEIGPLEAEAIELRQRLIARNERVARDYLDRIRGRLADQGIAVRGLVLRDGDVRRRLARSVVDEAADLVVLSAHGRGGHADVPHGSIAAYQLAHATTPLLIMNQRSARTPRRQTAASVCDSPRLPEQASP
jgi:nucleotide-binding universal stress UspA family protein